MITCDRKYFFQRCAERGYRVADAMPCVVKKDGPMWTIDETHAAFPRERPAKPPPAPAPPAGAGHALKGLLKRIGIVSTPNCKCNSRAREMDRRGLNWCRANVPLISQWLREECDRRKIRYYPWAGKSLIRLAIRIASLYPEAVP